MIMEKLMNSGAKRTIGASTDETLKTALRELCAILNNRAKAIPMETEFLLSDQFTEADKIELLEAMEDFSRVAAKAIHAYIVRSKNSSNHPND